ncbi:hypothetical protein BGAL_0447g00070 [Botrytis galanthina]|uniref:Uncharacterized protein n=1 Tax=Botrytis galanthina TaxID=278940 RepID=A0A4S8QLM7_9HELO|nr:hypothetical protein BGAL_0447g00070 [Botrytis galanthina]
MSSGGGRYESPPCRFDRERFERWKREAEGQEDEENLATREWKDEGKWKKNGGGRKLESEFRERWAEGLCVKCKAEKEGSRVLRKPFSSSQRKLLLEVTQNPENIMIKEQPHTDTTKLARKSSFAEIVKNLLSIDRELQAQRLSVHSASGRGKSAIPPVPPVPMIGKRRGMR